MNQNNAGAFLEVLIGKGEARAENFAEGNPAEGNIGMVLSLIKNAVERGAVEHGAVKRGAVACQLWR